MSENIKEKTHKIVDAIGGPGTSEKIDGKLNEAVGKAKESIANAKGDQDLHDEGAHQEAEGKAQQVVGHVKDAAGEVVDAVKDGAHKITDAIKHALHKED